MLALRLKDGRELWRREVGVPVRQTAAVANGRVFVAGEDLRVRCWSADTGRSLWMSEPLAGQSARDYYPVIARTGSRTRIVIRTNPSINMAQRIARDRQLVARQAGVDDRDWLKVDAWTKTDRARGTPELWTQEQEAIVRHLEQHPESRTFFVLDAETGQVEPPSPVLWVAGCQGVGVMPACVADGRLFVMYRSAYGNWNHGVAPLVALGLLDLETRRIEPLFHASGVKPPWNTFWGTADESQNFTVVGSTVLMVHQGTLSRFELPTGRLATVLGERDTYGGFRNPAWARNEWHGPGRGSVAMAGDRVVWLTGSRVLCLEPARPGQAAQPRPTALKPGVRSVRVDAPRTPSRRESRQQLAAAVDEVLSRHWAPFCLEPGLGGREFHFERSADLFLALAWACPHLDAARQRRVRERLAQEWLNHPPGSLQGGYPLNQGERREWCAVPAECLVPAGPDRGPHPFGDLAAVRWYAERCGAWDVVESDWPRLLRCFEDFLAAGWTLAPERGDLNANRYLAALVALRVLAQHQGDAETAARAEAVMRRVREGLEGWWKRVLAEPALAEFKGAGELDPFIGRGTALWFRITPHRHKLALLREFGPEVAETLGMVSAAAQWRLPKALLSTWALAGEERQLHYGENFVDGPDLAMAVFGFQRWQPQGAGVSAGEVDVPFCRADLCHVLKLAWLLER
jgi:hypothetical protein